MSELRHILSARDDNGMEKVIGFLVVAVIVGINAIIGVIKKRQEQKHRDQVRVQLESSSRSTPAPPPPVRPMRAVIPPAQRPAQAPQRTPQVPARTPQMRQRAEQLAKQRAPQRVAPAPGPVPAEQEETRGVLPETTAAQSPTTSTRVAVNARAISSWLRPSTLRQQFILTEVLQPPVALREPRF
jgi:hypothetical protein